MSENPERTSTSTGPNWAHELSDEDMVIRVAALHEAYGLLDPYVAEEVSPDDAIALATYIVTGRTLFEIEDERETIRQEQRQVSSDTPQVLQEMINCEETDYDSRGDCLGPIKEYVSKTFILGRRPGDKIGFCDSHLKFRLTEVDGYPDQRQFAPRVERQA